MVSDGDPHADHAVEVALPGRGRVRQAAQRQDEQDAGDEIEKGGRGWLTSPQPFFLYMASMRCGDEEAAEDVDRGEDSAMKPSARAQPGAVAERPAATPTASSAPTTITEEIALVTDISGVCSAGVTDQTT